MALSGLWLRCKRPPFWSSRKLKVNFLLKLKHQRLVDNDYAHFLWPLNLAFLWQHFGNLNLLDINWSSFLLFYRHWWFDLISRWHFVWRLLCRCSGWSRISSCLCSFGHLHDVWILFPRSWNHFTCQDSKRHEERWNKDRQIRKTNWKNR